jgi:hypothetical protein
VPALRIAHRNGHATLNSARCPPCAQLLLLPKLRQQEGRHEPPQLLGYFFPVEARAVHALQPQDLVTYLKKQGKLREPAAQQGWEAQWHAWAARSPRTGIPAAEPRVSSCRPTWEMEPGPLDYVTRSVLVSKGGGGLEAGGDSEARFCADCDCFIGPDQCGGAV